MKTSTPTPESARAGRKDRRGPIWRRVLGSVASLVLLPLTLGAVLALALWGALSTERGSAWVLAALPGVDVTAPRGSLLGDFEADRLVIHLPGGATSGSARSGGTSSGDASRSTLDFIGLGWRGLRVTPATAPLWGRIVMDELRVIRVDLKLAPSTSPDPLVAPIDLRLPVAFELRALRVAELRLAALGETPIRDLQADGVRFSARDGAEHRVEQLSLSWDRLQASGRARIGASAPLTIDTAMTVVQIGPVLLPSTSSATAAFTPPADWRARATLTGPLAAPLLRVGVTASAASGRPAQSLSAEAALRPFANWPLGEVRLRAAALDLAAFSRAAPATALSGEAEATSRGADQPARIAVALTNALAGRWNEARLPLRRLTLDIAGRPNQTDTLTVQAFEAELGTAQASAGQVSGSGGWSPERWSLTATLQALHPDRLDARAPAMQLNGTLKLSSGGRGGGVRSAPLAPLPAAAAPALVDVKADLSGSVTDRGQSRSVQLTLHAGVSAQRLELRELQARAGGASASLSGVLDQPNSTAPWALKANATLVDFDTAVWWPGGSPRSAGATRLNARAGVDLTLVAAQFDRPLADLLPALRGSADLTLADSRLAGVPLSGAATLRSTSSVEKSAHEKSAQEKAAAPVAPSTLLADITLDVAGNRLRAQGRMNPATAGADDAWDLKVDGPALEKLAPVFALALGASPVADARLAGSVSASAELAGRWPLLTTRGSVSARALRVGRFSVPTAAARWRAGTSAGAPVEAELTLSGATAGPGAASIDSLRLQVSGTGRAHNVQLRAESKALPPAWTDAFVPVGAGAANLAVSNAAAPGRSVAILQASGGLVDLPAATLAGWRGMLQQLEFRTEAAPTPTPAATPAPAPTTPTPSTSNPLLRARNVALEFLWAGGPARATLQPGRADLLGGAVRWSRVNWQAAPQSGAPALIDADIEVEPLRIAPLLARLQPDFGWGGDLSVGARLALHSTPGFSADIVVERRAGDLTVTDELETQALGLSDLRLALTAQNGVWTFTQAVAGSALGAGAGAVVVRSSPQALWPTPDAPVEGVFELQVARLSTWGTWVPPGWRIDGALRTSASIGGRFGAPQYTGSITGSQLSVRNFLQGVNVSDGDVAIRLQGSSAQIERFSARGGAGSLKVEGGASFGEAPQAQVTLTAQRFELLGRVDRRIVASGAARLRLDTRRISVDGQFNVDEGLIDFSRADAPTLASDVEVRRTPAEAAARTARPGGRTATATATATRTGAATGAAPIPALPAGTRRDVALDLRVALGEKLRVRGRGLDTGLRGELQLTSPGGQLAVNGTVRTVDGTYAAYGQKLAIDRGVIVFSGDVASPRLDIEATRPNLDLRVGVAVTGSAANPRVRLFSEPELSELDKLSWLVMGRASEGLGRADTALLQRAALALLSGERGGITEQFTKAIGLDDLSLRQTDGEVRETVISLGKQLSSRWYVGYERGLNATTGSWQLIYRIARRFTLRAQSGEDNSLDLIWTWRWQ